MSLTPTHFPVIVLNGNQVVLGRCQNHLYNVTDSYGPNHFYLLIYGFNCKRCLTVPRDGPGQEPTSDVWGGDVPTRTYHKRVRQVDLESGLDTDMKFGTGNVDFHA